MRLYYIVKDGKPFELPVEQGTETSERLEGYAQQPFAFASTSFDSVVAMKNVLPALLDELPEDLNLNIKGVNI